MEVVERIPKEYREIIKQFVMEYFSRRRWEIEQAFLGVQVGHLLPDAIYNSALADQLAEIALAAAGQREHHEFNDGVLYECIQDLMERLFAPPGLASAYDIPERFWDTPLGQMVARAFMWLKGDELITVAQAAKILGVTAQAVSQMVDDNRLRRYVDPDADKRQGHTLVSREEVAQMAQERAVKE